ncbi:Fpg/Nei family DNA glycosylase [Haloactinomyces albus]|uniref:Formamidopyrimidine-DNA glycosylase n=1 Tax=Haloactinomyces albus TaxID=1352928 RepID=A0AAE4CJQ5_9ACTN|nr:DNA-formamidopyrimidine glycosylase family protein [Haloactinomyces albus]MDR7299949.1 formamidopyrimidine-DNA glycosylase [Haloactinomyces albus]
MPELPDVEGFRRVAQHAEGHRLESVEVHDAQVVRASSVAEFTGTLCGRYFTEPRRHGKWLLLPTAPTSGAGGGAPCVLVHFGMTGMLLWCSFEESRHAHDRLVFRFSCGELRYRDMRKLTGLELAQQQSDVDTRLSALGPDAGEVSRAEYQQRLTRTRRRIKSALMDQASIAGLGNLCVDEILWHACIHPTHATADLDEAQWRLLHRRTRSVLRQSCRAGLVPDRPSWLTGHRDQQEGRCPRCRTRLQRARIAGRGTVWCPACQPDRSR